jgi:hypothetical protein
MLAAVNTAWAIGKRDDWADFDEFETVDQWLAYIRDPEFRKDADVARYLRERFTEYLTEGNGAQREALQGAIDLLDVVTLRT